MSLPSSAERNEKGEEYLASEPWQKMGTKTISSRATEMIDNIRNKLTGDLEGEDFVRVCWLSGTLFFIVGGYWLLRSLKDPIMSVIDGVEYIPSAKIASLFVVLALVVVYNKLLDIYPKHQLFYMMGITYGVLFATMGLLLMHPTIGLPNTQADPTRFLGWLSYVTIESFGSMVVQCFWALTNSSVDVHFAKKNFGLIVAGAQIGSILGPTLATQASMLGIPTLYLTGALIMFFMVYAMHMYISRFGTSEAASTVSVGSASAAATTPLTASVPANDEKPKAKPGIMEGFNLFYEHNYVKGIFCVSSLYMVHVTIVDYMMKVLAKERYLALYPDDPQKAVQGFASFMGYFGQTTNSISFLFSLFGTGFIIKRFGFTVTLISFPVLMLACTIAVWALPNIWVVFGVMMVMKGMSYALNNPSKEILYQMTSSAVKFKCKSWIDTFGQRSSKALGSLVTNQFATSMVDLVNYGSAVGIFFSVFLIWVSDYMGKQFEILSANGEKVGEPSQLKLAEQDALQRMKDDTSCGFEEEGQLEEGGARGDAGGGGGVELLQGTKSSRSGEDVESPKGGVMI